MGNHYAGRAIGRAARAALKNRNGKSAIQILDEICGPWRNCDAEFESDDPNNPDFVHPEYDDYTDPNGPIGKLAIEAFGDKGRDYFSEFLSANVEDANEDGEEWIHWFFYGDGPIGIFRKRYDFW